MKQAVTIPNWTTAPAQMVIIRARQIYDAGTDHTYYSPELQIVIKDGGEVQPSLGYNLKLDRRYNTIHELVMHTSMWADKMFDRVDRFVALVDDATGSIIEMIDVKEEFGVELAEKELYELKRTNMNAIH